MAMIDPTTVAARAREITGTDRVRLINVLMGKLPPEMTLRMSDALCDAILDTLDESRAAVVEGERAQLVHERDKARAAAVILGDDGNLLRQECRELSVKLAERRETLTTRDAEIGRLREALGQIRKEATNDEGVVYSTWQATVDIIEAALNDTPTPGAR